MSALFAITKRRRISSLISLLMLSFPFFLYIFVYSKSYNPVLAAHDETKLVIDAGHGGIDGGAIAVDGSKESDINLAIALKLRALAEFFGQDNLMIRSDDRSMSDSDSYSEHRDLVRRAEIVNSCGSCAYISIHQNCFPTGQPSGSLVIYASDQESESLGKLMHGNLISSLNPDNRRLAEPAVDKYYILSNVKCPAVLVECGFMSNFSDLEKLKSSNYQTSVASVLLGSFLQYKQAQKYI